jgi:Zn-dependent protease/CBS domain-containing protein
MTSTMRFGRVAGIEVGAHWTWLLVVALIVWSLAAGVFPDTNPGLSDGAYLAMGLVAAALFFASLLLHELGHALQARREGVETDGITLWALGGVARLRGEMPSPGAELRIAAAGPAVTLVIGAVCVALAVAVPLPAGIDGVIAWLGYINVTLLVFNLIPAFPLDGGRILRALLWRARGDLGAATRTAATAGRGFGILFIAGGAVVATVGGALDGVWLALIGFFLITAAEAELELTRVRSAVSGVRVADVMVADPVTVEPELSLQRFVDAVFLAHRHTAYPVAVNGVAIGLVSFRDVLEVPRERWHSVRVGERMHALPEVLVVDAAEDLATVFPELSQHELHRALVRVGGRPTGLLSITDVSRVIEVLAAARTARTPAGREPTRAATARRRASVGL